MISRVSDVMIELNSRVLVIGDAMLDRFLSGEVQRISPEAPVPIVKLRKETASPGGAGHVAASSLKFVFLHFCLKKTVSRES